MKPKLVNQETQQYLSDDDVIRAALEILNHRFGLKRAGAEPTRRGNFVGVSGRISVDGCPTAKKALMLGTMVRVERAQS